MNAERLHAFARTIRSELEGGKSVKLLSELVGALNNVVQQPQQANHQQQVSKLRASLRSVLESATSNVFSPAWRQHLAELGIEELLGTGLLSQVENAFTRNEITPASAVEELQPLADKLESLRSAVVQLTDGMAGLDIDVETLDPGEFELGVLIPRAAVANELGQLGEEFQQVRRILLPFVELATGGRPGFEVRGISSSDFSAYVAAVPAAAACIAYTLQKIIDLYKGVLEIRSLRQGLIENDVPDDVLDPVKAYVEERMERGLDALAEELRAEFAGEHVDAHRQNELLVEIGHSLRALANRIDQGYNFEVRHEPLPEPGNDTEGDGSTTGTDGDRAFGQMVADRRAGLQFINTSGTTILSLPEGDGPVFDGETADADG